MKVVSLSSGASSLTWVRLLTLFSNGEGVTSLTWIRLLALSLLLMRE